MKRLIALILTLSLTACAQGHWLRDDRTWDMNDDRECRWEVAKVTAPMTDAFKQGWMEADLYRQCLISRGYHFERGQ